MKGHKATYNTAGAGDSFWNVSCECGWSKAGYITSKSDAKHSHDSHVYGVDPAMFHKKWDKAMETGRGRMLVPASYRVEWRMKQLEKDQGGTK